MTYGAFWFLRHGEVHLIYLPDCIDLHIYTTIYMFLFLYVYTYVYIIYMDTCDSCERSCICIILIHNCIEGHMNDI